jgi:hypothetical protein
MASGSHILLDIQVHGTSMIDSSGIKTAKLGFTASETTVFRLGETD